MSNFNKNYEKINKSFSNPKNNSKDKNKLIIMPQLKGIENKLNSSFITQQTKIQKRNRKVFFQEVDNGKTLTKFMLKNPLTPNNIKLNFHKINSMPKLINRNSNKILNSIPKKSLLKKIGNKFNQSLSNENILEKQHNLIVNNNSGFNTTKNSLNISYNSFFQTKKNLDNDKNYDKNKKRYFSKFFYKSQSKNITSKRIYEHYIKEEERDKVEPEKPFLKFGAPRSIKQLKNLYKDNVKFQKRLKELKLNKSIAFKDDFNVLEYQSTLVKLLSKRISLKNLYGLQKEFIVFNEKNFGLVGPKGRFTNMAEKIKYNIPFYLYEKIRKLDTDKLISRYNYYKRINERISNNIKKKYELKKKKKKNEISRDSGDNTIGFQYDSLSN